MREAARGAAFVILRAWRAAPLSFALGWGLQLALSLVPAVLVLVTATLIERLDGTAQLPDVLAPLLVVVGMLGLVGPLRGVANILRDQAEDTGAADLSGAIAQRAARTPPSQLAKPEVTAELERHSEAVWRGVHILPGNVLFAIQDIVSTVAVVLAIATLSPLAAALTAAALLPAAVAGRVLARHVSAFLTRIGKLFAREEYLKHLLIRQRSAVELATLGGGPWVADRSVAQWRAYVAARLALSRRHLRSDWIVGAASTVGVLGALIALLYDTEFSALAVAGVSGIISGAGTVAGAGQNIGAVFSYGPVAAALEDFLAEDTATHPDQTERVTSAEELRVAALSHTYADRDEPALTDVAFEARRGELIALVGANGAGKTTAVRALLGLIEPTSGEIAVDGVRPGDVSERAWLGRFGTLVQEYERYELTVRENLMLGSLERVVPDAALWDALELGGLADLVRSLPDGLDTQLGEQWQGTQLSGGQWQRLALARVAVRDAPVWVLDEPTSAIDAESEEAILQRLGRDGKDRITVLVSHRAWTLRSADRIYVLDGGRVVEQGSYADLVTRPGSRFAELFKNQLNDTGD